MAKAKFLRDSDLVLMEDASKEVLRKGHSRAYKRHKDVVYSKRKKAIVENVYNSKNADDFSLLSYAKYSPAEKNGLYKYLNKKEREDYFKKLFDDKLKDFEEDYISNWGFSDLYLEDNDVESHVNYLSGKTYYYDDFDDDYDEYAMYEDPVVAGMFENEVIEKEDYPTNFL